LWQKSSSRNGRRSIFCVRQAIRACGQTKAPAKSKGRRRRK
jgi:hypothetical protein